MTSYPEQHDPTFENLGELVWNFLQSNHCQEEPILAEALKHAQILSQPLSWNPASQQINSNPPWQSIVQEIQNGEVYKTEEGYNLFQKCQKWSQVEQQSQYEQIVIMAHELKLDEKTCLKFWAMARFDEQRCQQLARLCGKPHDTYWSRGQDVQPYIKGENRREPAAARMFFFRGRMRLLETARDLMQGRLLNFKQTRDPGISEVAMKKYELLEKVTNPLLLPPGSAPPVAGLGLGAQVHGSKGLIASLIAVCIYQNKEDN